MEVSGTMNREDDCSERTRWTSSIWSALLICFVVATLINFGRIHRRINSDELVPILGSLYAWEPFFWDQLRLGQLVSLIAMPIKHPFANLLVQSQISYFTCLLPFFLVPRYLQRGSDWTLTGSVVVLLHLLAASQQYQWMYWFPAQAYGPALTLELWALILLEDFPGWRAARGRLIAATLLILLAHWEIGTTAILFAPLILLRYVCGRQTSFRECATGLVLNCVAFTVLFAFSLILRKLEVQLENPLFPFSFSPLSAWPAKWRALWSSFQLRGGWLIPGFVGVTLLPVLAAMATQNGRAALKGSLKQLTPMVAASVFFMTFALSMTWARAEDSWLCRYAMTPSAVLISAVVSVCWSPWWPRIVGNRSPRMVGTCVFGLLMAATLSVWGRPSLTKVRRDVDLACGEFTDQFRAAGVTHIEGDFWKVWRAMFHANLVAYERGEPRMMWGMGYRSTAMQRRWRETPASDVKLAIVDHPGSRWQQFYACDLNAMQREQQVKFETAVPPELFFVWARGFYGEEGSPGATARWARRKAQLWICNRATIARTVRLKFQLTRGPGEPAPVRISSDWLQDERTVGPEPVAVDQTFELPPGWHTMTFACDGKRVAADTDIARWLSFRVINAQISAIDDRGSSLDSVPSRTSMPADRVARSTQEAGR